MNGYRALAAVALAALGGLLLLVFWNRSPAPGPRSEPRREATRAAPRVDQRRAPERVREQPRVADTTPVALHVEHDRAPKHPHPITPEHVRMFRNEDLLHDAWKAMEARDFVRARELLATQRSELGQVDDRNEGLSLLADCMEQPDADRVAKVQDFYDHRTASTVRRRLRRFCLEPWRAQTR